MRILLDTNAFTTISVSDGISMSHRGMWMSLLSHELIADSGELVIRGQLAAMEHECAPTLADVIAAA